MNKKEIVIVVLLFASLLGWGILNRQSFSPPPAGQVVEDGTTEGSSGESSNGVPADTVITLPEPVESPVEPVETEPTEKRNLFEKTEFIENDVLRLTVSSAGGAIVKSELKEYPEINKPDSGPVVLDFSQHPTLSISGIPGLSMNNDFSIVAAADRRSIKISRLASENLIFERDIELGDGYTAKITDSFRNTGESPAKIQEYKISTGVMHKISTKGDAGNRAGYLGADTLSLTGGKDVIYWDHAGDKLSGSDDNLLVRFKPPECRGGCALFSPRLQAPLPESVEVSVKDPTDWIAVKNKFFVQIMAAPQEEGAMGYSITAHREVLESEVPENPRTWSKQAVLETVAADMFFDEQNLAPGETVSTELNYFVGPKKYSALQALGRHQDKVMFRAWKGWGWFRSLCGLLLWTLNSIYGIIPNYGVAIIILTIIVRLLFWPIMQKSTESMKKMQKIQPLIKEINEKYKDNPQKKQQATMALYKEHKVNPMASCLPMLIQMPIFIALFVMLRSAVELRFAGFLWISDLSEPERLFEGTAFFNAIPFVPCLNILPLLMSGTMVWQQKLTPSTGDMQQKQMMVIMPAMMLVMFYNMASALVLYWTVSQILAIIQLMFKKDKEAKVAVKA